MLLEKIFSINSLLWFQKNEFQTLINLGRKINTITLGYASKLGLKVCSTNIRAQKIDNSTLEMFGIILASFYIEDKLGQAQYF